MIITTGRIDVKLKPPFLNAGKSEAGPREVGGKMQDARSHPPQIALNYFIDFTCATN